MKMFFTVFLILIIIGFILIIVFYNQLIRQIEAIRNNQRQIDVQLDRRYKTFESLIHVVKQYMDYEKTVLKDVIELRARAQNAALTGDEETRIASEEQISKIVSHLNVVFEQYPTLQADKNVMQFQEAIVSTENRLAYSKQAYNDSVETYNATKRSFPQSLIVSLFPSKLDENFLYWGLSEEEAQQQEQYTVKF